MYLLVVLVLDVIKICLIKRSYFSVLEWGLGGGRRGGFWFYVIFLFGV